jgi:copper resistance protein C
MKQIGKILCLMLSLAYVSNGFAHAVVTDHTLKIAQPKANQAKKIELTFNSKIELGLSRVFLVSKGDVHTLLPIGPALNKAMSV